MTHLSPTTLLFCCTCNAAGFLYFLWHSWSFDKFQSLVPTRRRAFKTAITWSALVSYGMFELWSVGMAYIKYNVGFTNVPGHRFIPTPYEVWPAGYKAITPALYYILIVAWSMILAIHIEESCFWIHLARSIRGQTSKTWLASSWFKLWVGGVVAGTVTLFMVAIPFRDDPQQIETNVFFAGTCFTVLFTVASFYVILRFPALIETVRSQGGSQVVLIRLAYFRRLTKCRVFARIVFVTPFLIVSADGLTPHHEVAEKQFLTDLLLMLGVVGLIASTVISIYMFFPPSDPHIAHFAAGDSRGLLPSKHNMSIDAIRSYFEPTAPKMPKVRSNAPDPLPEGLMAADETKGQVRTELSIIAPFATPPLSPDKTHDDAAGQARRHLASSSREPSMDRGAGHRDRKLSVTDRASQPSHPSSEAGSGQASSAYAWNLLADHLRLPKDAMGLMAEATEMNGHAWMAARASAEQAMYPRTGFRRGGREQSRVRSLSPDKFTTQRLPLGSQSNTIPRPLPPPLRSPPKVYRSYLSSDGDYPYSATKDSEDLMSIVSKREER